MTPLEFMERVRNTVLELGILNEKERKNIQDAVLHYEPHVDSGATIAETRMRGPRPTERFDDTYWTRPVQYPYHLYVFGCAKTPLELAFTTIHELGHVALGYYRDGDPWDRFTRGHGHKWQDVLRRMGIDHHEGMGDLVVADDPTRWSPRLLAAIRDIPTPMGF